MNLRIGSGIDFHQLVEGRDLWIGGILIPHHKGS
ncbi:MAG: 2-C-methyl-D-erythritol 2,4-cyclodiphosphate synthase, partial [Sphingobacteriia bacterium]|nr:2-C-methyl-D-erythritol 2,4-cyclodiphosphate synthase [Sphingobacteriia bacterium]